MSGPRDRPFAPGFPLTAIASVALASAIHWYFYRRGFYAIGWDESQRALDAYAWQAHGAILINAWLPFYRVVVGLAIRAFPDLFLTPRIVSFLFGLATIPATAWLAHELFQNRKTTLLTLVAAALFSQRIVLGLAPLSDIPFQFLILAAIASLTRWLRTNRPRALLGCAVFGALASTVRYEGWLFVGVIFLVVACAARFGLPPLARRDLLRFGLILFIFPAGWAAWNFFSANPVHAVVSDARQYSFLEICKKNPLSEFLYSNALCLNLIGMAVVIQALRSGERRLRPLLLTIFAPLLITSVVLLAIRSAQSGPSWRMIAVWSMLLLPFTAHAVSGSAWPFSVGRRGKIVAACVAVLILSAFWNDTLRLESGSAWAFPRSDRQAGRFLDQLLTRRPDTRILIESSHYYFLNILVASQHPGAFQQNSEPEKNGPAVLPLGGSVRIRLESLPIRYLLFRGEAYKAFLNQSQEVRKLRDFGPWSLYELRQEVIEASAR